MNALCYLYKTDLVSYLDGELSESKAQKMEEHLASCGRCRDRFVRLRAARSFVKKLPDREPVNDLWPALEMSLNAPKSPVRSRLGLFAGHIRRPAAASVIIGIIGILMMGSSIIIATVRSDRSQPTEPAASSVAIDTENFRRVSIDQLKSNNEPHIMAEGYVTDISVDKEDGDMTFRLVSDPRKPDSFVVCEIMDTIKIKMPAVGSRVRVYGVSRFDGQDGHNWYEVHPVLGIEPGK